MPTTDPPTPDNPWPHLTEVHQNAVITTTGQNVLHQQLEDLVITTTPETPATDPRQPGPAPAFVPGNNFRTDLARLLNFHGQDTLTGLSPGDLADWLIDAITLLHNARHLRMGDVPTPPTAPPDQNRRQPILHVRPTPTAPRGIDLPPMTHEERNRQRALLGLAPLDAPAGIPVPTAPQPVETGVLREALEMGFEGQAAALLAEAERLRPTPPPDAGF